MEFGAVVNVHCRLHVTSAAKNALTPSLALWLKRYYVFSPYVRTNTFTHSSISCRQRWTALRAHFLSRYTTWKINVAVLQQARTPAWCNVRLSVTSQDMSDGFRVAGTGTNSYTNGSMACFLFLITCVWDFLTRADFSNVVMCCTCT